MATSSGRSVDFSTISTIFFDLDNTLIPTMKGDKVACNEVQQILSGKYKLSAEDAVSVTETFLRDFRKCPENSEMPLDEWRILLWSNALAEYSHIADEIYVQWLHIRYKCLAPSEDVIALLETLRKDYCIALISNGKSNSQWEKVTQLQLSQYFDCIFICGDFPWQKPDKLIFHKACSHLGVRPEECIMVGDKLETDILGAAEAGLAASIWIPLNECYLMQPSRNSTLESIRPVITVQCQDGVDPDYDPIPDFTINNVTELLNLLSLKVRSSECNFCAEFEDCNSNSSDGS